MVQANQRVGEYVLEQPIGKGAYAEVWRAHHHMWQEQSAAVKIPTDTSYLKNLRQEGIRVARLVHANIVLPIGFDPTADPPYIITDYLAGGSLRPWIAERRLTVSSTVNILRQVLLALQFGHEKGIVHGDIKPENILLEPDAEKSKFTAQGCVKVTDFGLGLAAMATLTGDQTARMQAGSMAYIAPEQREGAAPDVKSDLYSVGIVLFEMLTGERPSGAELPSELNEQVPKWLDNAFRRSYARRDRRFDSAKDFIDALAFDVEEAAVGLVDPEAPDKLQPHVTPGHGAHTFAPDTVIHSFSDDDAPIAVERDDPIEARFYEPKASENDVESPIAIAESGDGYDIAEPPPEPESDGYGSDEAGIEVTESSEGMSEAASTEQETSEAEHESDELAPEEESGPSGPALPEIPLVSSPAVLGSFYDELENRAVRTPDDVRLALRGFMEGRELDRGETAAIRLRLCKWANNVAGGSASLDDQISVGNALAKPLYFVYLAVRTSEGIQEPIDASVPHPAANIAVTRLQTEDYQVIAHFSFLAITEKILEGMSKGLRGAVVKLLQQARQEFPGKPERMDLLIFRVNVIVVGYKFDDKKYLAFMVGNALHCLAESEPFTQIREEPTKRAATLLDGEHIINGFGELRRALESDQWAAKGSTILSAVRGKLAGAYIGEARTVFNGFGWLESLEFSARAGQLVPGDEQALSHARLVRSRVRMLQLFPGLLISLVLVGLSFPMNVSDWSRGFQDIMQQVLTGLPLFYAGIAALVTTLVSNTLLGTKMARTDFAFYHAFILPLLVGGVIATVAPKEFHDVVPDVIVGVAIIAIIVGDVLLFKYQRHNMFHPHYETELAGDSLTVLGKLETIVEADWDRLRPHYVEGELGPLYSYTSVALASRLDDLAGTGGSSSPAKSASDDSSSAQPRRTSVDSNNEELNKLAQQIESRISTAARALAPYARNLINIYSEYSKAVSNHQIGMVQANGTKLEQKAKDLGQKLADFERLCKSPLSVQSASAEEIEDVGARLASRFEDGDVQILRQAADAAKDFRSRESEASEQLAGIMSELEAAADRLKKA